MDDGGGKQKTREARDECTEGRVSHRNYDVPSGAGRES